MFDYEKFNRIVEKMTMDDLYALNKLCGNEINGRKANRMFEARANLKSGDKVMINDDVRLTKNGEKYRRLVFTIVKFARKKVHVRFIATPTDNSLGLYDATFAINPDSIHKVEEM